MELENKHRFYKWDIPNVFGNKIANTLFAFGSIGILVLLFNFLFLYFALLGYLTIIGVLLQVIQVGLFLRLLLFLSIFSLSAYLYYLLTDDFTDDYLKIVSRIIFLFSYSYYGAQYLFTESTIAELLKRL
jgi:hypothetical protein